MTAPVMAGRLCRPGIPSLQRALAAMSSDPQSNRSSEAMALPGLQLVDADEHHPGLVHLCQIVSSAQLVFVSDCAELAAAQCTLGSNGTEYFASKETTTRIAK
jgi:hypothetical protein